MNKLTHNRPNTAVALTAVLAPFLYDLFAWLLTLLPENVPDSVTGSGQALAVFVLGLIAVRLSDLFVQRHTWAESTVEQIGEFVDPEYRAEQGIAFGVDDLDLDE